MFEKKRNLSLDGLKCLFAILIVAYHFHVNFYSSGSDLKYLSGGYLAVEGFFIISGFLLGGSIKRRILAKPVSLSNFDIAKKFIKDRYLRLFPEYFLVLLATIFLCAILKEKINYNILLPNLLLIANIDGIGSIVRDAWFISSLFYISIFYFFIITCFRKNYQLIIILLVFITLAILVNGFGGIAIHSGPFLGYFSGSIYRTLFDIGIGLLIYEFRGDFERTIKPKIIPILEIIASIVSIYYITHGNKGINNIFFVIPFSILVLTLIPPPRTHFSLLKVILENRLFRILSPYSYMLFLCHLMLIERANRYARDIVLSINPILSLSLAIILSILLSVVLKKISDFFWPNFCSFFIIKNKNNKEI